MSSVARERLRRNVGSHSVTSVQATLIAPIDWKQRLLPIACGCALVGAAAVVALNDPAGAGSHFPACQFHAVTGLWCPGCGLTRGFHQLFNGHPLSALDYNLFVPVVLVAVIGSWWGWTRSVWGRPARVWPDGARRWIATGIPVALIAYGVMRNIPAAPVRALAP